MGKEEWRAVVGYEGLYEVSDQGQVRSLDRLEHQRNGRIRHRKGRMRKVDISGTSAGPEKEGYRRVSLSKEGREHHRKIAVLVLEAFVGPRPFNYVCCHGPSGYRDDRLANLSWGTHKKNTSEDKQRDGTLAAGERNGNSRWKEEDIRQIFVLREQGLGDRRIAKKLGMPEGTVGDVLYKGAWKHLRSA